MDYKKSALIFLFLILLNVTLAEEEAVSVQEQDLAVDDSLISDDANTSNETILEPAAIVEEIIFKNFIPREFKLGDAQFSIQVQNNKNESITNLAAFVSGKGFSTYEVTPIESLQPEEKGYILIGGNFRESGLINLTVKIGQKTFYQDVNVLGESKDDLEKAEALLKQQEEKKKELVVISSKLEILKQNYSDLENKLAEKEKEGYEVKDASLEDLKKYLRETQASILGEHLEQARVNLGLATEEFNSAEKKIEGLKKTPRAKRFKDNAIIFSSIAGAILTFFALYELLKKKGKEAVTTMGSIKPKTEEKKENILEDAQNTQKISESDQQKINRQEIKEETAEKKEAEKKPKKKKKK